MNSTNQRYEAPEIRTLHGRELIERFGPLAGGSLSIKSAGIDSTATGLSHESTAWKP